MLKKVKICLAVLAISTLASIAVNAATVKNPDPNNNKSYYNNRNNYWNYNRRNYWRSYRRRNWNYY